MPGMGRDMEGGVFRCSLFVVPGSWLLVTADCQLPTADCQLLTPYCRLF